MRKLIVSFFALTLFCGCESRLDKAIPQSSLVGAVSGVETTIKTEWGDWHERNRDPKDWTDVWVTGIVPSDIKREQVKPTLLALFKQVKKEHPKGVYIVVKIAPDEEMIKQWWPPVGSLKYDKGKVEIVYGIPSDKQIEEHNAKIGQLEPTFKKGSIFERDYKNLKQNNKPRLFRPDPKTYLTGKKILEAYKPFLQKNKNKNYYSWEDIYRDAAKEISKKVNIPPKEIEESLGFMHSYFCLNGLGWDEEKFDLIL